ncbi:MAG: Hsp20/alpha crystallin family protein [Bacteroidota bacterium]|nr:Hsp20/alpha crystallin family protein [Bacteroidota bacterium]
MPHIKFDPMKELEFLSQRMRKFADEFPETFSFEFGKGFEPKVDVYHEEKNIHVVAELPGMSKEEISLSYADGVLRMKGTKKAPEFGEEVAIVRGERSFGEFRREIPIGRDIDPDSLSATMRDGVLTVIMQEKAKEGQSEKNISID